MYTQGIPVNTNHMQILNLNGVTLIAGSLEQVNEYKKANSITEVDYCKVYHS